jgi:hypothetical protein
VIVVASIARENVAVTVEVATTPVAPAAGVVDVTVGGFDVAAVVKLQLNAAASGVPSDALTAVLRFAVYVVERASEALGVSVAVLFEEL